MNFLPSLKQIRLHTTLPCSKWTVMIVVMVPLDRTLRERKGWEDVISDGYMKSIYDLMPHVDFRGDRVGHIALCLSLGATSALTLFGLGFVLVLDTTVSRGFQKPGKLLLVPCHYD